MKRKLNARNAWLCPVLAGIILIIAGLLIQIPGGALTTFGTLDGDKASNYEFDDKYSAIDEYVGGDAYNYIIGAALVAGKTAGAMAAKSICMVGGVVLLCAGLTLMLLGKKEETMDTESPATAEAEGDIGQEQEGE